MNKLNIYTYISNNGDWSGCNSQYCVASSKEEVINSEKYLLYKERKYDLTEPRIIDTNEILCALNLFNIDKKYDVNIKINIKEKY